MMGTFEFGGSSPTTVSKDDDLDGRSRSVPGGIVVVNGSTTNTLTIYEA